MGADVENGHLGLFDDVVENTVVVVAEDFVVNGFVSDGFELEFQFVHMCCIVGGDAENSNYWRWGGGDDGRGDFGGKGRRGDFFVGEK